jgi:hypothetical protein
MSKPAQAFLALIAAGMLCAAEASAPEDAAVQRVIVRASLMVAYDRAAGVTSDDMVGKLPKARRPEIGGRVVTPIGASYHVDWFGKDAKADRVIYAADVRDKTVSNATVYPDGAEPVMSEAALRLAQSLTAARAEMQRHPDWQPCTAASFNTIVLPPDGTDTISVFFLTAQVVNDEVPFGGHYEVDVASNGHVLSARSFTKAPCANTPRPVAQDGRTPAGLGLTHLLDPQPTEIHVFEQLALGVPLFVETTSNNAVWKVENGQIRRIKAGKDAMGDAMRKGLTGP